MKKFTKALIFGILFLILACGITMQFKVSSLSNSKASKTKVSDELKDQIFELNNENSKLVSESQKTDDELDSVRADASKNSSSDIQTSDLIKKYSVFTGNTDVVGQGVSITYKQFNGEEKADIVQDLLDIVNELKNAGAEAISINDQRFVDSTSVEMVKNKIEINGVVVSGNFTIKAIGDENLIYNGLIRPGGTVENISASGVNIDIKKQDNLKILKYNEFEGDNDKD